MIAIPTLAKIMDNVSTAHFHFHASTVQMVLLDLLAKRVSVKQRYER